MRNVPLFAKPEAPALRLSKALAKYKIRDEKGAYTAYRVKARVACWECVNVLHEADGKGEPPRGATTARTGGGERILLCGGHTELWKRLDGIGEKPKRAARGRR